MRFLVDENLPRSIAESTVGTPFEAIWVGDVLIREQNPEWMRRVWVSFLADPGTVEGLIVLRRKGVRRYKFG